MLSPKRVLSAVGQLVRLFSLTLLVPIPFAFVYEPYDLAMGALRMPANALVFLASFLVATSVWLPIHVLTRRQRDQDLQEREAYLTVGAGWIAMVLVGMLPFLMSQVIPNPIDAFFETMAGITTTGSTLIQTDLDSIPRSVMLWRALLQYVGGMGIIVLGVALLARLSHGGIQLLAAEAPGPSVTRLRPKLAQTAKILWSVYAIFSGVVFAVLLAVFLSGDMRLSDAIYDAFIHTFTSLSTGGFNNHSTSIAHFGSWIVELVLLVTMLVAGTNFTLHYHALQGDWRRILKDSEWRFYMALFFGITLVVTLLLALDGQGIVSSLRGASFTVASLLTSTGYATADFDTWPDAARFLLLVLMFTGGTAGSTAGGLKVVRILILLKVVRRSFQKLLHPRAVIPIRLGKQTLKDETVWTVIAFFFTYVTLWMVGTLIIVATDPVLGLVDGASAAASAIGNMGPALGVAGPTQGYWDLLPSSKLVLSFLMWAGRLELFAALLLLNPQAWKN